MIKAGSYKAALATAKELDSIGIRLKARPTTVLGDLVTLSSSFQAPPDTNLPMVVLKPGMKRIMGDKTADERATDVEWTTQSGYDNTSQHSLKIEALADDIAPFITSHLSHARNTVAPIVTDLTEKLFKFKESAQAIDPSTTFEIISCSVPAFLLDDSFVANGLENYNTSSVDYPYDTRVISNALADNLNISWHDPVHIAEFLNVGNDRLNKMIFEWMATLPEGFMDKTFHGVFANYNDDKYPWDVKFMLPGAPGANVNMYHGLNVVTACYLIATSLMRVTKNAGTDGEKIRMKAREVLDYAGGTINRYIRTITRQVSSNVLVNEIDTADRKAYVHEPVYSAWLEKGGRPETILGMIVSGTVYHDAQTIDEARDKLDRAWSGFVVLSQTDIRRDLQNRLIGYIKSEVLHGLNDLTDLEKEYANGDPNFRQKVAAKIDAEIKYLGHRITDDLAHTALHLVAKTRFFYTSAYSILSQMEEIAKHNPEIDPREAALLSTISYICEYFENQLVIER